MFNRDGKDDSGYNVDNFESVATLRPLEPPARRVFGGRPDLKIPDEFFFEPLADEELALWE